MKKNKTKKLNFDKFSIVELNAVKMNQIFGGSNDVNPTNTVLTMTQTQTSSKEYFSTRCN